MDNKNKKVAVKKNKKMIRRLCYVSLVLLVILLLTPPLLRAFVKEKEENPEPPKVVTVLSCEKENESVSSTFLNQDPQNLLYKIKGNYTETKELTPDEKTDDATTVASG